MSEASRILARCRLRGIRLTAAESCTGGLIAAVLTDVPGSSDVFERGFVTYSNEAKTDMLGVPPAMIAAHGAVSAEVAAAMAVGALAHARAELAVSVTGIAGPGGGSAEKPVGLVYIATAMGADTDIVVVRHAFTGDRQAVRGQAVSEALAALAARLG